MWKNLSITKLTLVGKANIIYSLQFTNKLFVWQLNALLLNINKMSRIINCLHFRIKI